MQEKLERIVGELPILPEADLGIFEQVSALAEIAQKLGMTLAANMLTKHIKLYGPKPLHAEQLSGEIYLCNSTPETFRYIGWKTKRAGNVALNWNGTVILGEVPVFVRADELAKARQLTERETVAP